MGDSYMREEGCKYFRWTLGGFLAGTGVAVMGLINVPIGILLLILGTVMLIWEFRSFHSSNRMLSTRDACETSTVVWGCWHTGADIVKQRLIIETKHIKRILVPQTTGNDNTIQNIAELADSSPHNGVEKIKSEILALERSVNDAHRMGIEVELRKHRKTLTYAFTIYDKNPIKRIDGQLQPLSSKAYVVIQVLEPQIGSDKRHKYSIKNKGEDSKRFREYYDLYEKLWELDATLTPIPTSGEHSA